MKIEGQLLVAENLNWEGVQQAAKETAGDKTPCARQDCGKLLEDPMTADVTFVVDGQRYSQRWHSDGAEQALQALLTKPGLTCSH